MPAVKRDIRKAQIESNVMQITTKGVGLLLLFHLLCGGRQGDGFHGELHFANATKEVGDEDAPRVPQEQVGTVARSGHTLTLRTHLELEKRTKCQKGISEM